MSVQPRKETIIQNMKYLLAVLMLLTGIALAPFAVISRAPILVDIRSWMFAGLVASLLFLILVELWLAHSSARVERLLRILSVLGLFIAVFALTTTLAVEARFRWARKQVTQADAGKLEKLGRHFIIGYRDLAEIHKLVKLRAVAGVFISAHNVRGKSVDQIRQEIESIQKCRLEQGLSRLWIATDQEGGAVSRMSPPLNRLPKLSEIVEPSTDIAQIRDAVWQFGLAQGRELASIGVNLNFAPVVDLNFQVKNPKDRLTRIRERAISDDPAIVTQVAAWYCSALEESGVRCTLKHFPGLGRVFEDTHQGQASLATSVAELDATDWTPFRSLMGRTRAFTMLSHVRLTAIDSEMPVSVSAPVIAGMLRDEWKYEGVLITDNFSMLAIYRSSAGIDNASIEALNAGVDLILVSYDSDQYYRIMYALLQADEQGKLDREALNRSDQRLLNAIHSKFP